MKIKDIPVLILAGGKGTRLQSVVKDVPKPMADINGIPFLDFLLDKYKKHKIYLSIGYKKEAIIDHYTDYFDYIIEDEPLGTGGAIKKAFNEIDTEYLIVINGDTYVDIDLPKKISSELALFLLYQEDCSRYGHIEISDKIYFREKRPNISGFINSGVYIIKRSYTDVKEEKFSLEERLENTVNDIDIDIHISNKQNSFIDIGIPDDYFKFKTQTESFISR